jgi:hypothetical protein
MARRRPSRASSKSTKKIYRAAVCEELEERLQFVVLHGGDTFVFSTNGTDNGAGTGWVRVVVTGNTTVELVGAEVSTTTGAFLRLNGMDGIVTGPDGGVVGRGFLAKLATVPTIQETLYAMDVVQSDSTSGIAVASITDPTTPGPHPMLPYAGLSTLRINPTAISNPTQPNYLVTGPATGGGNVLGALTLPTPNVANTGDVPILNATVTPGEFTFVPSGNLTPGLQVTSGDFGSFLFSGTITGNVVIHGSINQFYAGWIVTGNSSGENDTGIVTVPDNFQVDGDLRDLISAGSLGTDDSNAALVGAGTPRYSSGFDMQVAGRIGQINVQGNIVGSLSVSNNNPLSALPVGTAETEVEDRGPANSDFWDTGILGTPSGGGAAPFLVNDTFNTAQYVGGDSKGDIVISGTLQATAPIGDNVDYYAVPLMAGQVVTVQVIESLGGPIPVGAAAGGILDAGVFDPDGRLIATDTNRVDVTQTQGEPFQFTADRPGVYRFAVASTTNLNFDAGGGNPIQRGTFPYTLSIQNVGNLAISGLVAAGAILDNPGGAATATGTGLLTNDIAGFHVLNGDLGAAVGLTSVISEYGLTSDGIYSFAVDNGNLRSVEGAEIGNLTGNTISLDPSVSVPRGNVGLLRATGAILAWNVFVASGEELTPAESAATAIGGDYQWVDASAGTFIGDLVADGNIGTIRANDMQTITASYLQVNASFNPAVHGTIDLIDSQGNIGTLAGGGPGITTGPGGNVRYVHIGPQATVFGDLLFGGGAPQQTLYQPGETAVITDDSGTVVSLTPVGGTPVANFNPSNPQYSAPASLTVLTLAVRGSGGSAIVKVISSDGLAVAASGAGGTQSAEIGTIQLNGTGTQVKNNNTLQPLNGGTGGGSPPPPTGNGPGAGQPGGAPVKNPAAGSRFILPVVPNIPTLAAGVPLTLTYSGAVKIDTFDVSSTPALPDGTLAGGVGFVTALTNTTGGEIVNIHVNSLGTLTSNGAVGIPLESNTPSAVLGLVHNPLSEDAGRVGEPWIYPFLDPTSMVRVTGNIVSISAKELGNVYAGFITSGGAPGAGTPAVGTGAITNGLDGNIGALSAQILGPIVAAGSIGSSTAQGGFAAHGSGAVGGAGLYAVGIIGSDVSNGDMRGELVSTFGQASIVVNNGSIAEAAIGSLAEFDFAEQRAGTIIISGFITPITKPQLDIGSITVNGNGGIIGSEILADHAGVITVGTSGFGIFDSQITTNGEGTVAGINVGGYGIRDGLISGGASIGPIVVRGDGGNLPVTNFSASVRQSETGAQFTSSGTPISFLNDIDSFLGTTAATPSLIGVTDNGVIEDLTVQGSRDLTSVTAYSIRGRDLTTLASVVPGFVPALTPNVTTFDVANSINNLTVAGPVNGLNITTGRTSKYVFGGDVSAMDLTVAGPINNLVLKSSFDDNSSINAIGPSGHIGSLTIDGNLAGSVTATTYINMLHVLGSISGTVKATRVGTIHITGAVGSGGLTVNGPLTSLIVDGSFGPAGTPIQVNGNAGTIRIRHDLGTNINVTGNLQQLIVGGSVLTGSNSTIGGVLNLLQITGDVQAGATIQAELIKRQRVKGQILGSILP